MELLLPTHCTNCFHTNNNMLLFSHCNAACRSFSFILVSAPPCSNSKPSTHYLGFRLVPTTSAHARAPIIATSPEQSKAHHGHLPSSQVSCAGHCAYHICVQLAYLPHARAAHANTHVVTDRENSTINNTSTTTNYCQHLLMKLNQCINC